MLLKFRNSSFELTKIPKLVAIPIQLGLGVCGSIRAIRLVLLRKYRAPSGIDGQTAVCKKRKISSMK